MKLSLALVVVSGLLLAVPAAALHAQDTAFPPRYDCEDAHVLPADANEASRRITCQIPAAYRFDVTMAEVFGKTIRLHDMAAWLTTDELLKIGAFDAVDGKGRGWLTREEEVSGNIEVRYFTESDGRIAAVASAVLTREPFGVDFVHKLSPPEPATDRELRLLRAKRLVLESGKASLCTSAAPNTVVLEMNDQGRKEIMVYVMSAFTDDVAPLGGFHLFHVTQDGTKITNHFSQTKSCPTFDPNETGETVALMVTHLTSPTPTMFHVFMSLQYRKPMYVSTVQNELLWRVERGEISLVEDDESKTDILPAPNGS